MREILQVFCAGLGTLGFALFFRVRPVHLLAATLGGVLSWTLYLVVFAAGGTVFSSTLVAALAVCLWAETMARVRKAPATVFLVPGIIPLLPGGALYYAMDSVVTGDMDVFLAKGKETVFIAVGIVPQEIRLRSILGRAIEKSEAASADSAAAALLAEGHSDEKAEALREQYFYHPGTHGLYGALYLIGRLTNKKQ